MALNTILLTRDVRTDPAVRSSECHDTVSTVSNCQMSKAELREREREKLLAGDPTNVHPTTKNPIRHVTTSCSKVSQLPLTPALGPKQMDKGVTRNRFVT